MSARQQPGPYDSIARKWLHLAERRKAHFIDLYDSGRWKHYYSESEMIAEVRAAVLACDDWAKIVGVPPRADVRTSERGTRVAGHVGVALPDQRYRV
jgi:uncharacterized repeat protein (TIGR03809 family)